MQPPTGRATVASGREGAGLRPNRRTGARIRKVFTLVFEVFNLFDPRDSDISYHYESRVSGDPVEEVADVHFHPMEPLTWRILLGRVF